MADRLSDLDALFLAGETPTQHMHVLATLVLDASGVPGGIGYGVFHQRIAERFHLIAPLRRKLQPMPVGPPIWVDDAEMHLERHLHHVVVPGGGPEVLARVAGDVASKPLPKDRPLWEAWFVEGLDDGRAGVVAKVHHSALDGVSGFMALAAFFDFQAEPPPEVPAPWRPEEPPTRAELTSIVVSELRERPRATVRTARRVMGSALAMLRNNSEHTPFPMTSPRTSFNHALTPRRSVAFTRVPLDSVKDLRRQYGVTVNDVVVGLCAGVVRSYLVERDELPDRPLVAAVPTSERTGEHGLLGNHLSFMFYALPVHLADPKARLLAAQQSATAAKDLYAQRGVGLLADVATLSDPRALGPLMRALSGARVANVVPPLANVTVSNVRGPEFPLFVAGARLESMYPMGPLLEGVGLGITVVSYRDEVAFGFMACPELLPDVDVLATAVHDEVERLAAVATD